MIKAVRAGSGPSRDITYNYKLLLMGVIKQAVYDLRSDDPLTKLDALDFWLSPEACIWLDLAAGIDLPQTQVFTRALTADGFRMTR